MGMAMEARLAKYVVPLGSTLLDAIEVIKHNRSRCAVVTSGETVVGVLSEGDIMSALLHNADVHAPIDSFIHYDFKFLSERNLPKALDLMRRFGVTLIPIVDSRLGLLDAITTADVLNAATVGESG
jgi:CBS domain-containing protein